MSAFNTLRNLLTNFSEVIWFSVLNDVIPKIEPKVNEELEEQRWFLVDPKRKNDVPYKANFLIFKSLMHKRRLAVMPCAYNVQDSCSELKAYGETFNRLPFSSEKKEQAWINSDLIGYFFSFLAHQYKKVSFLDPGYFNNKNFISQLDKPYRANLKKKLKRANLLFWPVEEDNHWRLLIIQRTLGAHQPCFSFKRLDGFNQVQGYHSDKEKVNQLLSALYGQQGFSWAMNEEKIYKIPTQNDGENCATAMLYFAEKLCQSVDLKKYKKLKGLCDYSPYRLYIAQVVSTWINQKALLFREKNPEKKALTERAINHAVLKSYR